MSGRTPDASRQSLGRVPGQLQMYASGNPLQTILCETAAGGEAAAARREYLDDIAKALIVLNLLDAIFTLYWIRAGLATEWNALMRDLVVNNAMGFVLSKLALVSLGAYWLLRFRRHRLVATGLFLSLMVYLAVCFHHLRFSSVLLLGAL